MSESTKSSQASKTLLDRIGGIKMLDQALPQCFVYILKDPILCGFFIIQVYDIQLIQQKFKNHLIGLLTQGIQYFQNTNLQLIHQRLFKRKLYIKQKQFELLWHYVQKSFLEKGASRQVLNQFKEIFFKLAPRVMNTQRLSKKNQQRNMRLKEKRQRLQKMYQKQEKQKESKEQFQEITCEQGGQRFPSSIIQKQILKKQKGQFFEQQKLQKKE